jgi:hypothetical protein
MLFRQTRHRQAAPFYSRTIAALFDPYFQHSRRQFSAAI